MVKSVTVIANQDSDERVIQQIAAGLRRNDRFARQLRDFADTIERDQLPGGLQFQPRPGQMLMCHFGLGFEVPENVKTRPVIVLSPRNNGSGLCLVAPISSKAPTPIKPYHFKLPDGLVPGGKYEESWVKGDMLVAVGLHRLDRVKVGFRKFESPIVPAGVLKEIRRCALYAIGMHSLTVHW